MNLTNKKILIISTETWGRNFLSKHHYALNLAKLGNKVFFLEPTTDLNDQTKELEISDTGFVRIVNDVPKIRGVNKLPFWIRKHIYRLYINRLIKQIGKIDIVWSFDPFRYQNLNHFNAKLAIYHPVDIHRTHLEYDIARNSSVIFSVSELILKKLEEISTPKYFINHAIDELFLNFVNATKNSIDKSNKLIKVGYIGSLQSLYFDNECLKKIVLENKEISFHFIGPYAKSNITRQSHETELVSFLKQQPNVNLLGSRKKSEIPELINNFDLFLLCYDPVRYFEEVSNSHKFLEYLSTGKVVVSNYMYTYKDEKELIEMVKDNKDLPDRFRQVINNLSKLNSSSLKNKRIDFARNNTYQKQIKKIESILNQL